MLKLFCAVLMTLGTAGSAMAQDRIRISSDWGEVTADLANNPAAKSLVGILPLTVKMNDHLRQEKTGKLPSVCPSWRGNAISLPGR